MEMVKGHEELYAQPNKLLEQVNMIWKTWRHVKFKFRQHMWLNIRDFKMPHGLTPHFITKYARPHENLYKLHLDMYNLKVAN
jgi:hypothetical protein